MKLAVLVTCFNRVKTTLRGVASLRDALGAIDDLTYKIFLVDDASPDGTGAAVRQAFPEIIVIEGTGSLFWNGGMCLAYRNARRHGSFDAYLLFNDDVVVDGDGVAAIFADYREANSVAPAILGGSTTSPDGAQITYSGYRRIPSIFRPRASESVPPDGSLRSIDMPNGNFLLAPGPFFESIGGLDSGYIHDHGDIDLGLVAKKHGVPVYLARRSIGVCEANPIVKIKFKNAPFWERWRMLQHPLKRPNDYQHYVRKHMPRVLYPFYMTAYHAYRVKSLFLP
jgi:GT2 family glycosyltransferase